MARHSKRRGEQPSDVEPPRPGVATARSGRTSVGRSRIDDPTDPLGQAAPDAELAEAQLLAGEAAAQDPGSSDGSSDADVDGDFGTADALAPRAPARSHGGVVGFARGSWRELQRVQWPDQRQVVQATGVVIGFVIVAGAYLGLADWVAGKIVHFILS